jgi:hypothetical protein
MSILSTVVMHVGRASSATGAWHESRTGRSLSQVEKEIDRKSVELEGKIKPCLIRKSCVGQTGESYHKP